MRYLKIARLHWTVLGTLVTVMTVRVAGLALAGNGLARVLRAYRAEQALQQAMPAMNVFGDKVLKSIVAARPGTLKQLQAIKGIGASRGAKYGADIVRMVNTSRKQCPRRARTDAKSGEPRGAKTVKSRFFAQAAEVAQICAAPVCAVPVPSKPAPCKPKPIPKPKPKPKPGDCPSVYVLELAQGRVYVGSSKNVERRVAQHMAGTGSAYTKAYKPTGVLLPRLGNVGGEGDAAERDETLRYMMLRGIPYVRGWKFTQVVMNPCEFDEAEANIRELFDLCRKCGYKGHFMTQCRATYDRWGQEIGAKKP